MANKKSKVRILVMILAFGMMAVGCANSPTNSGGGGNGSFDSALNGTWVFTDDNLAELKINSGNWENLNIRTGAIYVKGTCTTNNGRYTEISTHIYGGDSSFAIYGLEAKWYSKEEFETALVDKMGFTNSLIIAITNTWFLTTSSEYSIIGNLLTFTDENGFIMTLIRK
jgi:hypothetical protein